MSQQILKHLVLLGFAAGLLFLGLFSAYGWQQGFAVGSGLWHLVEMKRDPVVSNPVLEDVVWQIHENVLWSINDSGSEPTIFAMDEQGADLGEWRINVDKAVDWEALDSFFLDGVSYLVIGDTGDNLRWRPVVWLLIVPEPTDLDCSDKALDVAWKLEFSYPDGFRDSEALAVDVSNNQFFVLSKRHYPPELFRLPLRATETVTAEFVQEMHGIPHYTEAEYALDDDAFYRHMPSGMDIAGDSLLITTYKHAYLYSLADLEKDPLRVKLPSIWQRESISFARGSNNKAYVTQERYEGQGVADVFSVEFAVGDQ